MNKSDRKKLQTGLYIGLAIALILCLFPMPYGFYQFVRFAAMAILHTWHTLSAKTVIWIG